MRMNSAPVSFAAVLFLAEPAAAHQGMLAESGFVSGFAHPLGGLDHLLAMFAVGLLAARLGGRAIWLVPGAFVSTMLAGAVAGLAGVAIPGVELGIALSIVAISLPAALAFGMPATVAMAYVGTFALFHGNAHGLEIPASAGAAPYMAGFTVGTALIHAAGVAVGLAGLLAGRNAAPARLAAAAIAATGLVLIAA